MAKKTTDRFLIGSWVSFYPFSIDSYEYQLDQMAAAGLNFNIFPMVFGGGMLDAEAWDKIEKEYEKRDMLYLMNGGMNREMLDLGIEFARGKKRCIGYHLIDEPGAAKLAKVGEFVRAYRDADKARYPFVNLFPSYAGRAVMEGDYYKYCSQFVKEAGEENIEYLSHDYYPFHEGGTMLSLFTDMEVMRRVAFEHGRLRTHAFPQSTRWKGTRMPNADEMRWHVYAYLAYGFKALSWFNLVCPGKSDTEGEGFSESLIYRDGQIHDKELFAEFSRLNHEVLTLGDTLIKLDTVHAYHTKETVPAIDLLPADWMITPVGDGNFVISQMVSPSGDESYVMIFNNDFKSSATGSFRISRFSGIDSLDYLDPFTADVKKAELIDGVLTESFRPGEGRLYRLGGKLAYRVFPLENGNTVQDTELSAPADIVGVDIALPLISEPVSATVQISSDGDFDAEGTVAYRFDGIREVGKLRFDAAKGRFLRLTYSSGVEFPEHAWSEIRLRFADEPADALDDGMPVSVNRPDDVIIPRGADDDTVASLMPKTLIAQNADGSTVELTPVWNLGSIKTSISGTITVRGTTLLPDGTPTPLTARVTVTVTYEVDFSALDEAIAKVEALNPADYTEESWRVVQGYYDAAVAMKDGTYPQNAVTVAAWQLEDRIKELKVK